MTEVQQPHGAAPCFWLGAFRWGARPPGSAASERAARRAAAMHPTQRPALLILIVLLSVPAYDLIRTMHDEPGEARQTLSTRLTRITNHETHHRPTQKRQTDHTHQAPVTQHADERHAFDDSRSKTWPPYNNESIKVYTSKPPPIWNQPGPRPAGWYTRHRNVQARSPPPHRRPHRAPPKASAPPTNPPR
jgi:hypothetical protein